MHTKNANVKYSMPGTITDSVIDELLTLFEGDVDKAIEAVRTHKPVAVTEAKKVPATPYAPTGAPLIEVRDLQKSYKVGHQKVDALRGVNLTIHEGEFVALTGASGSGKSTLLQIMGGLDKPTVGTVSVDGHSLTTMRDAQLSTFRNKTIGFVFQFFYLQPFLKIGTNLEVPGMFARIPRKERRIQAELLADKVGLSDRIAHLPKELSGGQMQRAAIARALLNRPKVLLADEPTGNLDSTNSAAILELFEHIRKEYGTTIVVVTHDPAIAAKADREISMKDGEIIQ